ncbi:hypothetical protein Tchl_1373 [Thauera chlorobenzoica]|uniref:Uncharacterized protein n=1 Tax=Thauera chlorobenzoica TaxID=96773 RepID=A0A1L6FBE9_9RHOO|nr:hypothetical protein Tchl_1373 [Thauera chlorobenzoica]
MTKNYSGEISWHPLSVIEMPCRKPAIRAIKTSCVIDASVMHCYRKIVFND